MLHKALGSTRFYTSPNSRQPGRMAPPVTPDQSQETLSPKPVRSILPLLSSNFVLASTSSPSTPLCDASASSLTLSLSDSRRPCEHSRSASNANSPSSRHTPSPTVSSTSSSTSLCVPEGTTPGTAEGSRMARRSHSAEGSQVTRSSHPADTESSGRLTDVASSLELAQIVTPDPSLTRSLPASIPAGVTSVTFLGIPLSPPSSRARKTLRLSADEWKKCFGPDGVISASKEKFIRRVVYYWGMDDAIRAEVWKYLLGYMPFAASTAERQHLRESRLADYNLYKSQWKSFTPQQLQHFGKFIERKTQIEKDVQRTDRQFFYFEGDSNPHLGTLNDILVTYAFFNFNLGYIQGMNDLLVPILVTMEDESDSFWCFVSLMNTWQGNFQKGQPGMLAQLALLAAILRMIDAPFYSYLESIDCGNLLFCYRWLLILFKREFEFAEILRLWDVMFACPHEDCGLVRAFHVFFAASALIMIREVIVENQMQFDDMVKTVNDLSGQMKMDELLHSARKIYEEFIEFAPEDEKRHLASQLFLGTAGYGMPSQNQPTQM